MLDCYLFPRRTNDESDNVPEGEVADREQQTVLLLVNKLVGGGLVESVIESEVLVVQVLCQINLRLRLVNDCLKNKFQ